MITYDAELKIFQSSLIDEVGYLAGFGTKDSGDGTQLTNLLSYFRDNNIIFHKIVTMDQIHSANIGYSASHNPDLIEKIEDVDGVLTHRPETALIVRTADCLPIIFVDQKLGLIGISHQGWRGSLKKLQVKMVDDFVQHGSKKESIVVVLGPSINDCCYDIDDDRYYEFLEEFDGYAKQIFHMRKNRWHLNLALLNFLLLKDAGIGEKNIDHFPFCTRCDNKRFFSYRGGVQKHNIPEMFSFVMKT